MLRAVSCVSAAAAARQGDPQTESYFVTRFYDFIRDQAIFAVAGHRVARGGTACLRSRRHGMTAPCGHAMTGGFEADEVEAAPGPDSDHVHPHRDRSCWCKTELNQQLWLLSAIGADQEHCSVVL